MLPSELPDVGQRAVAFDTETSGLHWDDWVQPEKGTKCRVATVSVAWLNDDDEIEAYAFPFDQGVRDKLPTGELMLWDDPNLPEEEWLALLDWLEQRRLIAHNAKFDLAMMREGTRHWKGRDLEPACVWDTMVVARRMWPLHSAGLKQITTRLELRPDNVDARDELKAWIQANKKRLGKGIGTKDNPRYDLVPWDVMEAYAAFDAADCLGVYLEQVAELEGPGTRIRRQRARQETEVTRVLYRIERRGMGFDAAACRTEAAKLRAKRELIAEKLPFDPSPNGAKRYFFQVKKVEPVKTTESGTPQLDEETRRILIERGVRWMAEYDQYTRMGRALSMWYDAWPNALGDDGRLRMTFRQVEVKTGRMSAERVQLHAIPKNDKKIEGVETVRSFFRAKPGYELWNLDLSQAELRVASRFANCTPMLEMLEAGADLHGITTEEIFHIDRDASDWSAKRDIAKRLTFGGIFQIGAKKFQATLSQLAGIQWTEAQCEEAVKRWRGLYPQFTQAYYQSMKQAERVGWVELVGGERSYFGPRDYPSSAWNRRVQASLAKLLKFWLIDAERILCAAGYDDALIGTVHDSLVIELPSGVDTKIVGDVAQNGANRFAGMFGLDGRVDVSDWHHSKPDMDRQYGSGQWN